MLMAKQKEAFVASLLSIVRSGSSTRARSTPAYWEDGLTNNSLWKELQKQINNLRQEMDGEDPDDFSTSLPALPSLPNHPSLPKHLNLLAQQAQPTQQARPSHPAQPRPIITRPFDFDHPHPLNNPTAEDRFGFMQHAFGQPTQPEPQSWELTQLMEQASLSYIRQDTVRRGGHGL